MNLARIFASSLRDMKILTDKGLRVGRIYDIIVNENTGKVETLVLKPESEEIAKSLKTDEDGNALVPFSSVVAVRDYIVVSEKSLAIQKMKGR
ncbi:MAG: PRC-barrel domain-containing protein [Hadesarchaea archaeon]|nr:PRC-barrel domain-containing protein [Hadesarchaea archaeon]